MLVWRPRPELNRGTRFCRPLRNHSATWPKMLKRLRFFRATELLIAPSATALLPNPSGQAAFYGLSEGSVNDIGRLLLHSRRHMRI
jgi:hypothetical protein